MALTLYASTGATTTQLNDEAPFRFESAEGLSGAAIVRHEQRSPLQSGATDLGYRLQPRVITLNLIFRATTDALLDTYRSALMAAFKPLGDVSTFLSVQRDDGEIRTLTVHRVGDIAIELAPEYRPGHMHRAILKLRAASPLWRSNGVTSQTYEYSALTSWWLAGGAISASDSKTHVESPAQGEIWNIAASLTGTWAVAYVTAQDTTGTVAHYAFDDGADGNFRGTYGGYYGLNNVSELYTWPASTADIFHAVSNDVNSVWWYLSGTAVTALNVGGGDANLLNTGRWRSNITNTLTTRWSPAMPKATIFANPTEAKMNALAQYMTHTVQGTVTMVNDGDVNAYPFIRLNGPIRDPVIRNLTTGGSINLAGLTLGSLDYFLIDLRTGDKTITDQAGVNQLGAVTNPVSLANFYLAPAPIASGGTNTLVVIPGSVDSSAYFTVEITNQYVSF